MGDVMARRETRVPAGDKALVVVSDMLQNSAQFTVFGTNAAAREPERLRRLVEKTWKDSEGAGWALSVHQVQGGHEPQRLEQAPTLWRDALRRLNIAFNWERL